MEVRDMLPFALCHRILMLFPLPLLASSLASGFAFTLSSSGFRCLLDFSVDFVCATPAHKSLHNWSGVVGRHVGSALGSIEQRGGVPMRSLGSPLTYPQK